MSWLFSRALVEEFSGGSSLDGKLSAPLKKTTGASAYCLHAKTTDRCPPSRYGMTFARLTECHGEALLTWYLADSHARTSAAQARRQDLPEKKADSGWKWPASFAKFDRATSSWKTRQASLFGDSTRFLGIWPKWGSMLDGECSALTMPDWITAESELGLLPTPVVTSNYNRKGLSPNSGDGLATVVRQLTGCWPAVEFFEAMMDWPVGWTDLAPLDKAKFQQWLQQRGAR